MKLESLTFVALLAAASVPLALFGKSFGRAFGQEEGDGPRRGAAHALEESAFVLDSGELNEMITPAGWQCPVPDLPIEETEGCRRTGEYPACKWQVPPGREAKGLYKVWWRTPPEELWGSKELVRLIVASIAFYKKTYSDDEIYVGDLDAPKSGHASHRNGVDADLYLLRWMEWIQVKDAKYEDNMKWRSKPSRKLAREKVTHLARSLAVCSSGRIQIFYNDPLVLGPFNRWFEAAGYTSPLGPAMKAHNHTHHDHFHVRISRR